MQEQTVSSCIPSDSLKLRCLLNLDEKAPICRNRSENQSHGGECRQSGAVSQGLTLVSKISAPFRT